ncbi:hypothetical protein L226DRAFT_616713 [Lentinus tigrinus ALCF2SS1-7]|uniref:Uncharacterized protein n=1 Tax=Lentinus tigrinus ALCF2SS1-6 TaxID=1328759 RepID=A0A5C2RVC2_9APHY|nr:hypothetical protein L227DRAFT_580536 [Lentinus tigrinus ALCF2SS1-6]RPD69632.1 hypothetical protein L226DRAFT_616713 [Lentinus tigrinus ALCF2SS1-7]
MRSDFKSASACRVFNHWRCATRTELQVRVGLAGRSRGIAPNTKTVSLRPFCPSQTFASLSAQAATDGVLSDTPLARRALKSSSILRTLDPTKLTPKDHITSVQWPSLRRSFELLVARYDDGYPRVTVLHDPPLEDSGGNLAGFLYYHQPPHAPPLAGELRFRITASGDPESFPSGVDYTMEQGIPWSMPLPTIAGNQTFAPILHLLTDVDATVPHRVMELARENQYTFTSGSVQASRYLYAFGQPFHLPLTRRAPVFEFVGKERVVRRRLEHITAFCIGPWRHYPRSGSIICCFEPSPLKEHSGKRVAVIRVLRTLEHDPVRPNPSYTGPPIPPELYPREGELLMKLYHRKVKVWAADVDAGQTSKWGQNAQATAFSVLFENALEYGSPYGFSA